jgi:SAM-dependent methyltransferase
VDTRNPLVARNCPNCQGPAAKDASVKAVIQAETLDYDTLGKSWRGFFRDSCFFSYHRCTKCAQLFAPTYLSERAMTAFYSTMGDNIHSGDEQLSRLTQQEYVDATARYATAPQRYLEIGPDVGLFLDAARAQFPITEATLIEPNQAVWPRLEQSAAGLKTQIVATREAADTSVADGSMDLIVAIHVLDHLLEPAVTLEWIKRKLAKGGVAVFVVHNERSLLARLMGKRWPAYCLQHPQLYNPSSLAGSLTHSGLKVREVTRTANYFPVNYLIAHVLFALTKRHVTIPWPRFSLRLKLGNIVAIASKD